MILCPYFNTCNGCACQHIDYAIQLNNKLTTFSHIIKDESINIEIFSGPEYYYRNRMEFLWNQNGPCLRGKNNKLVNVDKCIIANKLINTLLSEVKVFFKDINYFNFQNKNGCLCYVVIRTGSKSSISFVLNKESDKLGEVMDQIKKFSGQTTADSIIITYTNPDTPDSTSEDFLVFKGSDSLSQTLLGNVFEYSVQGFFQNNIIVAEHMHKYVHNLLLKYKDEDKDQEEDEKKDKRKGKDEDNDQREDEKKYKNYHLLDLYAGVGTFGINNANLFKTVTIAESFSKCIDSANINIQNNKINNAKAMVLDAKNLRNINLPSPLVAILDPPRSGMHNNTIGHLNKILPKSIIYISCNIQQLKKDIPKFKKYKITSAALFDQFPQTNHIEAIIELTLK